MVHNTQFIQHFAQTGTEQNVALGTHCFELIINFEKTSTSLQPANFHFIPETTMACHKHKTIKDKFHTIWLAGYPITECFVL